MQNINHWLTKQNIYHDIARCFKNGWPTLVALFWQMIKPTGFKFVPNRKANSNWLSATSAYKFTRYTNGRDLFTNDLFALILCFWTNSSLNSLRKTTQSKIFRTLIGAQIENPAMQAWRYIRKIFATSIVSYAVHGSDSDGISSYWRRILFLLRLEAAYLNSQPKLAKPIKALPNGVLFFDFDQWEK